MTTGQRINIARMQKNLTLQDLADKSGVSCSTIIGWIYRNTDPKLKMLVKIADVLEMTLDDLVGRKLSNEQRISHLRNEIDDFEKLLKGRK